MCQKIFSQKSFINLKLSSVKPLHKDLEDTDKNFCYCRDLFINVFLCKWQSHPFVSPLVHRFPWVVQSVNPSSVSRAFSTRPRECPHPATVGLIIRPCQAYPTFSPIKLLNIQNRPFAGLYQAFWMPVSGFLPVLEYLLQVSCWPLQSFAVLLQAFRRPFAGLLQAFWQVCVRCMSGIL